MIKNIFIAFILSAVTFMSCKQDATNGWQEKDLLEYGFAVTVLCPPNVEIKKNDLVFMQDLTLRGSDGYNMQIFMSDATTNKMAPLLASKKEDVKYGQFFSKFIAEYDDGFIYEKEIDGNKNYDFRRLKVFGDKEYEFRAALIGSFSEEQVRAMFEAVTNK